MPDRPHKLSVIIPAYNEESTILDVLDAVRGVQLGRVEKEIVVVDDGSTDRTRAILGKVGDIRLVLHDRNRGKGAAVKTGFKAAKGDIVLIQDADMEYDPGDYPALIKPLLDGRAVAVMGSRFAYEKPVFFTLDHPQPFFTHYIGNRTIIALTNLLYGHDATDYEGAYKAFTKKLIESLPIEADGFEYDNELICKLLRRGVPLVEVPIRYRPRSYEDGKKITWRDGMRMLWTIVKWRFKSF